MWVRLLGIVGYHLGSDGGRSTTADSPRHTCQFYLSKHETLNHCWVDFGPASEKIGQH